MPEWTWSEDGFYSLQINVSLPNVSYVHEGLLELEITVHTAKITNVPGGVKLTQFLPEDRIVVNVSVNNGMGYFMG